MKRVLCALVAAGLVGLVGCGKEGTSTAPPKPGQPGDANERRKLEVRGPTDQSITQNETEEMSISIDRENFTSAVKIELSDLPKGVTVVTPDLTIPAGKDDIKVTLKAAPDATVAKDHVVKVTATATGETDLPPANTTFKLDVEAKK